MWTRSTKIFSSSILRTELLAERGEAALFVRRSAAVGEDVASGVGEAGDAEA